MTDEKPDYKSAQAEARYMTTRAHFAAEADVIAHPAPHFVEKFYPAKYGELRGLKAVTLPVSGREYVRTADGALHRLDKSRRDERALRSLRDRTAGKGKK